MVGNNVLHAVWHIHNSDCSHCGLLTGAPSCSERLASTCKRTRHHSPVAHTLSNPVCPFMGSQHRFISIVTRPWAGQSGLSSFQGYGIFSSPKCPDQFWGPQSPLLNGYQRLFLWGSRGQGWGKPLLQSSSKVKNERRYTSASLSSGPHNFQTPNHLGY